MKKNAKTENNKWLNKVAPIVGLLVYCICAALVGVCFLFWPLWICVSAVSVYLLIFPVCLLLFYRQKLNALLYALCPALIYTAGWIYLSTRSWLDTVGINIATSVAKSNLFGLLDNSGYATQPKLIFLGISGALLTGFYPFCFIQKVRWRWFLTAFAVFLIASVFVFWKYIELYLKS